MTKRILSFYEMNAVKRTVIAWIALQALLWAVFAISVFIHKDAWVNVKEAAGGSENYEWWSLFLFIVFNNLFICILIIVGNLFARFNFLTPGVIIILIQIIGIGWMAGSNSFEVPFASVADANLQFLKVGLWEVTAYILCFSATIPKSLNVSSSFLPKKWDKTYRIKDIKFSKAEIVILIIAALSLISAAVVETFFLT